MSSAASATEEVDDDVYSVVSGAAHLGGRCGEKLRSRFVIFFAKTFLSNKLYKLTKSGHLRGDGVTQCPEL